MLALGGDEWSTSCTGCFTSSKPQYPLKNQSQSGWFLRRKNFLFLPEFTPQKHNSNANEKDKDTRKELNICASNQRMIAKNNEQRLKSLHLMKNK
jgi:hypothetical protein